MSVDCKLFCNFYPANAKLLLHIKDTPFYKKNKNDNIHKNEVKQIRWSDEYWKYRVAANITEYQNNLPNFMEKRQLIHLCKNQQV